MSIKLKLVFSNMAMILIPVVSSILLFFMAFGTNDFSNFEETDSKEVTEKILKETFTNFVEISYMANNDADKFKDNSFLRKVDNSFFEEKIGIVVIVEDSLNYVSNEFKGIKIKKKDSNNDDPFGKYDISIDESDLKYYLQNLNFSDGESGELLVLFDLNPVADVLHQTVKKFIKGLVIVLILTTSILTFIVSRSILIPLRELKFGAEQIKQGNLEFKMKVKSRDEIGQTCIAFEEMRKRLKEAIDKQMKLDDDRIEFLASITHDLKTPITSIKGYVEGIRDGIADTPEKLDKYTKTIYTKAVDMDRLIDDLTFYSNKTLDKIPFNYSLISLKRFMEDFIDENSLDLDKKNIILKTSYDIDENTKVKADIEKLKRVILNIVDNSVKYMDKKVKKIKIELSKDDDKIVVGIHDNGSGVKKEELMYIFEKFYRTDPSRNSSKGGSGLGLAISKQIIDEHEGKIWADSVYKESMSVYFSLNIESVLNED